MDFTLPYKLVTITVEDEGSRPAAFAAGIEDDLLHFGRDGVFTTAAESQGQVFDS